MREIVTIVIPRCFVTSVDGLYGSFRKHIGYMVITTDTTLTELLYITDAMKCQRVRGKRLRDLVSRGGSHDATLPPPLPLSSASHFLPFPSLFSLPSVLLLSLSLSLSFPSFLVLNPARESWERFKLPRRVLGRRPYQTRIFSAF